MVTGIEQNIFAEIKVLSCLTNGAIFVTITSKTRTEIVMFFFLLIQLDSFFSFSKSFKEDSFVLLTNDEYRVNSLLTYNEIESKTTANSFIIETMLVTRQCLPIC